MSNISLKTIAVLGGGCFWCLEAIYQRQQGVSQVNSGYAGGSTDNPTYKEVCGGNTGHAEVVEITFDPEVVSYKQLVDLFWQVHDPTTKDAQGADIGTQYRSIILAVDDDQLALAKQSMHEAQAAFSKPIVTQIEKLDKFWLAEAEHHEYYNRNKFAPYCMFNITPKLKKLGF